ncbi:MAG: hypothetical protein ACR2P7_03995 [bacterium]
MSSPNQGAGGGSDGGGYGERLAAIEAEMRYMATKTDVEKVKVWVLSGVLGGMGVAVALTIAVMKWFFNA